MSSTTENPCARTIMFGGEMRNFNLNNPHILAAVDGGISALSSITLLMHFGGQQPLAGQYGSTLAACLKRFEQNVYSIVDIEHIIALGLIGAGMSAAEAFDLVDKHVKGQPVAANALIAYEVLAALFVGIQSEAA